MSIGLVMSNLIDLISGDLQVPVDFLDDTISQAHNKIIKIKIKKRNGEYRIAWQPSTELKLIQTWLNFRLFSLLPVSDIAMAFVKDRSILDNAKAHCKSKYSIRIDMSSFFQSIVSADLVNVLHDQKNTIPPVFMLQESIDIIRTTCFDSNGRLPIGYPTSPSIANCVMYRLDLDLIQDISFDVARFGSAIVTRYADDFVFSTDKKGACAEFFKYLSVKLDKITSPRLKINNKKTRFMSKGGGSTLITGLRVGADGGISIHADHRDHIRLLLKHFRSGKLKTEDKEKLRGHLAFIKHADPSLYTKLAYKFYNEIEKLCTE
jgi:RNA-directed DNA polymerase